MKMEIILICLMLITLFLNISLSMLFYLHMYQLNSYRYRAQLTWIKNKFVKEILFRNIWLAIPTVISFSKNIIILTVGILISFIIMLRVNRKRKYKKPIKYTNRMMRLIITTGVLNAGVLIFSILFLNFYEAVILLCGWAVILPLIILLSNFINMPIEEIIKRKYIKEAKRILMDADGLTIIGITGSYGKTSTKYFLQKLLSEKYNVLITPGNFNTTMGVVKTIRENLNATHNVFLCEMGARHVNDIKEICDLVHPKYGIISSIGPQHLETFHSMDNIIKTKFELTDSIPDNGAIFLNYNNEHVRNRKTDRNIVSYGVNVEDADYTAENVEVSANGSIFTVVCGDKKQEFKTKLIGVHNVENIIGAIAVANKLGISLEEMVLPVRKLDPVSHRLELVKGNSATIIDDAYNSNPIGAKAALDTLNCFEGMKILITPGMVELGEKQEESNKEFGKQASSVCDYIVLVGREQTKPIFEGIKEAGYDMERVKVTNSFVEGMAEISEIETEKEKFVLIENDLPDNY